MEYWLSQGKDKDVTRHKRDKRNAQESGIGQLATFGDRSVCHPADDNTFRSRSLPHYGYGGYRILYHCNHGAYSTYGPCGTDISRTRCPFWLWCLYFRNIHHTVSSFTLAGSFPSGCYDRDHCRHYRQIHVQTARAHFSRGNPCLEPSILLLG